MVGPKRITGFMALAKQIVRDEPGLTAQEIYSRADKYARQTNIRLSASSTPEASLVATLHKTHREHGLKREIGRDGKLRYFPEGQGAADNPLPTAIDERPVSLVGQPPHDATDRHLNAAANDGNCCIDLPSKDQAIVEALVGRGKYADLHEAHRSLVSKGLDALLSNLQT